MQNLIPINLVVGDRTYRIKINADDEELIRKTAKKLNERLAQYKSQYAGKDMQDYLAMVLLSVVTEQTSPQTNESQSDISLKLEQIESMIDRALEE